MWAVWPQAENRTCKNQLRNGPFIFCAVTTAVDQGDDYVAGSSLMVVVIAVQPEVTLAGPT
jgi:hypothetical protein